MLFTLNRNKTVASNTGHTIAFIKDKPVSVPREMWSEVRAIGAVPQEEIIDEEVKRGAEPADSGQREKMIMEAMKALVLRNKRGDFTANNVPHTKPLALLLGFEVDHRERDVMWKKVQLAEAGAVE